MADFGVQKPWEPPKTNASKSRSRTKRQRKQKALRIEAGTHLPLVWALPDGVAAPELADNVAAVIRARLGFVPTNLLRVHTIEQRPAVLELYPLKRQPVEERAPRRRGAAGPVQPWPTTYWFVDELLSARIAALEAQRLTTKLDPNLSALDVDQITFDSNHFGKQYFAASKTLHIYTGSSPPTNTPY